MNIEQFFCDDNFVINMRKEIELCKFANRDAAEKLPTMGSRIYDIVWCILEVAKSSFVSRSYNTRYGLTDTTEIFESVGAHTNLVAAIITHALWFYREYYSSDSRQSSAYSERFYTLDTQEIFEAVRLHDLCENRIGDIPDNGDRDNEEKNALEMDYYKEYMSRIPLDTSRMSSKVLKLLKEMQDLSSEAGRLIYLSDKVSALIAVLCLDDMGKPPVMLFDSPYSSERDRLEMSMCDYSDGKGCKASEMWTIDYFKMRRLFDYDDMGFFTAIILMTTLVVNRRWYNWRLDDYKHIL